MRENKIINFDFLEILTLKINKGKTTADDTGKNVIYNIDNLLNKIYQEYGKTNELSKTTLKCMGDKARIQKIIKHKDSDIWELQMLRLKETASFSGIADDNGDFILHNLDDGKYVGESTTVLYDSINDLLLIQRNYGSLTPSGFEKYLNTAIEDKDIYFNVVMKKNLEIDNTLSNIDLFRNLDIGITFRGNEDYKGENELILSLYMMANQGAKSVRTTLTVGQGPLKGDSISPGLVRKTVKELYTDPKTNNLSLKYKENINTHVEILDLLDNREKLEISINKPKKLALSHNIIYPIIYSEYCNYKGLENKKYINKLLQDNDINKHKNIYKVKG